MEILAPIKDKESTYLAINLKVEAIYCSGPFYSARQSAGISMLDLQSIIEYAHLYQTKVYVTLNTIIFSKQIDDVLLYIDSLIQLNIDALIIQDLGLLSILKDKYPLLELHASTQMHVHNIKGVEFIALNNIKRVVLPRESSLKQLKNIKNNIDIEIETFIHGALCTSYSGQCYYGAFYNNGSGNLGTCQQNCRKPHNLNQEDSNALLSLKDLALQDDIVDLVGISDSFKIEGRLKSKEYLYSVIKYYQSILNNEYNQDMANLMQVAFNRQYTKGYFNYNGTLNNKERVNNHGLLIGEVVGCDSKYLSIKLINKLTRLDNIRIINNDIEFGLVVDKILVQDNEVDSAHNKIIKILHKNNKLNSGQVYLVKTRAYENIIKEESKLYLNKVILKASVIAQINKPLIIKINNQTYTSDFIIEQAKNNMNSKGDIIKQLSKTNDTAFVFDFTKIEIPNNIFIVKSSLNAFRRAIIKQVQLLKLHRDKISINKTKTVEKITKQQQGYVYMIRTYNQALVLNEYGIKEVFVDNLDLLNEIDALFNKVIPVLPRVIKDEYFNEYTNTVNNYEILMVSELGMLEEFKNNKTLYTNYSLNISNEYALAFLKDNQIKGSVVSIEINDNDRFNINDIDVIEHTYGYIPLMIMDYCPLNKSKEYNCLDCHICQDKQHYLYNSLKQALPLVHYAHDNLELFSHYPKDLINQKNDDVIKLISFTIEDDKQTHKIMKKVLKI